VRTVDPAMTDADLRAWLTEDDPVALDRLYEAADAARAATVGPEVHLRGLIEVSNTCTRACSYCGISVHNKAVQRYRMGRDEILACAQRARDLGYGTVVMQAGEDPLLTGPFIADIVRTIKREVGGLAVTLSLGERSDEDLRLWRAAGADRYLLRFESSNPRLYARIHPAAHGHPPVDPDAAEVPRLAMLRNLHDLGYQAGSGVMVGIPGQTWDDLVGDLRTFQRLDIEMIGVGPYIPHPATPLAHDFDGAAEHGEQVPNTVLTALKMVALARLLVPDANIPATTAVATLNKDTGREDALKAGANVVMPNLTPPKYRALYEIYPDKACVNETAEQCHSCLAARIHSVGRCIGSGFGDAPKSHRRTA
jgi:biotin synthase